MNTKAPVFFISHGAPTFALEPGVLGVLLQTLGKRLTNLKAVLVMSPHWQTKDVQVMTTVLPETIHDFGGFSSSLYALQYRPKGQPDIAKTAAQLLIAAGFATQFNDHRGLDHGAWIPLLHLLPKADVPVFQVSMPFNLNTQQAVKLGQALVSLRNRGVLIVASGGITHNLDEFRPSVKTPEAYVQEFANWVRAKVLANETDSLIQYRTEAPHAERAHPSEEHFLPLLIAMGAQGDDGSAQLLDGGITNGVLSMDSYVWGMPHQVDNPY